METDTPQEDGAMELVDPAKMSGGFALNPSFFGGEAAELAPLPPMSAAANMEAVAAIFAQIAAAAESSRRPDISTFQRVEALIASLKATEELLLEAGFDVNLTAAFETGNFSMADSLAATQKLVGDLATLPTTPRFADYLAARTAETEQLLSRVLARRQIVTAADPKIV